MRNDSLLKSELVHSDGDVNRPHDNLLLTHISNDSSKEGFEVKSGETGDITLKISLTDYHFTTNSIIEWSRS